jgi:acyl carrier protein
VKGQVVAAAPLSEVRDIIRDILHEGDLDLSPDTRFDHLTNWDSMDLVSVVVEAECRFDLQFEMPEIDRLVTIGDLVRMIGAKQALAIA